MKESMACEIEDIQLKDLINVPDVQEMMDSFYLVSKIPMAIIDLEGTVIVGAGWQEVCTKFHRVHPVTSENCHNSDLRLTAHIPKGEFRLYKCKNGMWDMATPIYLGDRKIGNLFTGQFFFTDEKIDYDFFNKQALKYRFDDNEYSEALRKVPVLDRKDVENAKAFFLKLADTLIQLGNNNLAIESSAEETKRLLENLEEYKLLLEQTQAIAHLGSWELDLVNNNLKWSDEVFRIFGIDKGDSNLTYDGFLNCIHPDDRKSVARAYESSLVAGGDDYDIEHRIIRKDTGEIRYIHEKCVHVKDKNGEVIRSVGMVHDISGRKKAEFQLRESEEKLSITLDVCNIGIWDWNIVNDILVCDSRMLKMLNVKKSKKITRFRELETLIHDEDLSHFRKAMQDSLSNLAPLQVLFRTRPSRSGIRHISLRALVDQYKDDNPLRMIGVCFDVTQLEKNTEILIDKLNEDLLRSNKDLETFAYVASHDLQEPLRMVSSFMQLLERNYSAGKVLDETALEYIQYAVDGSKRMYELINGLLVYSRVKTRASESVLIDVNTVLENVKKSLGLSIEEKDVTIISDPLPMIHAERNQINQLFQNLISNSIKFNREKPVIKISCRRFSGHHLFSIEDNGIGISPEYFERIFQIFQRLNPRDQYEGTGIGLAICRRIVERHGGRIWLESAPGAGTTFFFTIPVSG